MSRIQAFLFAGFTILLVVVAVWAFRKPWLPDLAADRAAIDARIYLTMTVTGIAFILTQVLLAVFIWRFRAREGQTAAYWHDNPRLEFTWTAVTAGVMTILVLGALRLWAQVYSPPPADALLVEVTGQQFAWNVRYPGPDGVLGRTDPRRITVDNPLGIDDQDPRSADDIFLVNQLYLPVGRPVRLRIRSKDVIHSFFLPNFRVKQDAVPGMTIDIWFTPTQTGTFELACAEHCGLGHYRMRGFVVVQTPEEFAETLASLPPWSGQ